MDLSKFDKMSRFKLLYFVICIINLYKIDAQISDKRLCVDEECKVPISHAKTLLKYSSPDPRILSFAPNVDITIYSKSAGSREDLWGGEINGKRGYVPKHMVRETRVLQKPTRLVNTEFSNETETKQVPSQVEPNKVQQPFEVVDGTTIYLNPQDDINPTSTESPVQPTALPATVETNQPKSVETEQLPQRNAEGGIAKEPKNQNEEPKVLPQEEGTKSNSEEQDGVENTEDDLDEDDDEADIDDEEDENEDIFGEAVSSEDVDNEPPIKKVDASVANEDTSEGQVPETKAENVEPNLEQPQVADSSRNKSEVVVPQEKIDSDKYVDAAVATQEVKQENVEPEATFNSTVTANVLSTAVPHTVEKQDADPRPLKTENTALLKEDNNSNVNTDDVQEVPVPTPDIEVTTISSEIEVPQPFDEILIDVTPNPVEETKEEPKVEQNTATPDPVEVKEDPKLQQNTVTSNPIEVTEEPKVEQNTATPDPVEEVKEEPKLQRNTVISNPIEVTEEPKVEQNTVPTLPPLGLFANSQPEPALAQQKQDLPEEKNELIQNSEEEKIEDVQEVRNLNEEKEVIVEETQISEEKMENIQVETSEVDPILQQENNVNLISESVTEENQENQKNIEEEMDATEETGFFGGLMSYFRVGAEENANEAQNEEITASSTLNLVGEHKIADEMIPRDMSEHYCDATSCPKTEVSDSPVEIDEMDLFNFNPNILLYLITTAISVIIFLFGYIAFDKNKREGPLIAKINKLEKEMLIIIKENQILQEKVACDSGYETNDRVSTEVVENLKQELLEMTTNKIALEEQVQSLEKELENSTEVGMELNRMLSEILSSESGSDVLKANVEHLQRQLVEQQATINSVNETLAITNTENHELRLELDLSNKKVIDLQAELDKLLLNILKIEEEKETQQNTLETELATYRQKFIELSNKLKDSEENYFIEIKQLKNQLNQVERKLELKTREHDLLTEALRSVKNNDESTLKNILEVGGIKAEFELLKAENQRFSEKLLQEQESKSNYEKKAQVALDEAKQLKEKYDEADKSRVEMQTKLEVLSNYFKDREAQWQKEISKHEALWAEKQGEATSTTERINFMQEQLQNYKAQTESLKQEIMSQEIELKSQISVLEKKAHENWVSARQAERKLEEAKQEAAQLRHRLTLRERAIQEDKNQQRLQSPIEQNGEMPVSPLDSPASPPLLYGTRDHITKSPPLPGLPPFLPPPPGVPFMPPPLHGVPPFIPPPPPNMFPGDHRPPPLGRMSSPPLNSRYSPSSRGYSPYDRNSSSPSDSEYGTSPPHRRGYSPFNNREDRRDYKRPPPGRSNGRMMKGGSSGSGHSNESLEKISRQHSKV